MYKNEFHMKKTTIIKGSAVVLLSLLLFFLIYNNYSLYDSTIAKVTTVQNTFLDSKNSTKGNTENYYKQQIQAIVKNGPHKGQLVHLQNTYGESLVYDNKYSSGTSLFIENLTEGDKDLTANISGVKRDYYVAAVVLILVDLLIMVGGLQGFFTILCLSVNIILFYAMLLLHYNGLNILLLSSIMSVLFSSIVLFLINGRSRTTVIALCATLASIFFVTALSFVVMRFTPDIDYEFLEYLIHPYERSDADMLFLSEILMGCVGAIIDISVTITSCASELLRKDPFITKKALISSCREVSEDITGTMINTVFFTNVSSCIPLFILSIQNEIKFMTVIRYNVFFEVCRFLTGSIGIVAAIPVSILAVYLVYGRRDSTC
ncbi:YibE/F family protein [Aminipila luticellarii]|uniref:YibE/F family protein n=1 Tax=Aminipila luticellarii TaxID=2507160 RepID=A0A410PWP5_9FIRM|nr:YibE/F family protein [Aminipila luticellarii]QAT43368.1 YibE/F family protein [Aminipila luticellarii]